MQCVSQKLFARWVPAGPNGVPTIHLEEVFCDSADRCQRNDAAVFHSEVAGPAISTRMKQTDDTARFEIH